jgi:hypothetical protein
MTKKRLQTAKHEAGHVVLHLLKGISFSDVWVGRENNFWSDSADSDDANGGVEGSDVLFADTDEQREVAGVVMMGGLAGERVDRRSCGSAWRNGFAVRHACGDINDIRMSDLDGGDEDMIDHWLALAHAILQKYRDLHERLTDALIERRRLSYDECLAIFEQQADEVSIGSIDRQGCWL